MRCLQCLHDIGRGETISQMQSCYETLDLVEGVLNDAVIARVKVKYLYGVEPKSFF